MAHLRVPIASVPEPRSWFLAALVAGATYYRYWPCRGFCWLAPSKTYPKNNVAMVGREFCRWRPDVEAIVWMKQWVLKGWDFQGLLLSVKSTNNEEFECSQLEAFLPHSDFFEKNERVHLQLHSLYHDINWFENSNKRALGPSGSDKTSNFSYP